MNFSDALLNIKQGRQLARTGWNSGGQFVFLVPGSRFTVNRAPLLGIYPSGSEISYRPHIDIKLVDGSVVPWIASQSDLLANDWRLFEG